MASQDKIHTANNAQQIEQRLRSALQFAHAMLVEENLTQSTHRFLLHPERSTDTEFKPLSSYLSAIPEGYHQTIREGLSRVGTPVRYPIKLSTDSQPRWLETMTIEQSFNAEGDQIRLVLTQDISSEVQREDELKKALELIESITISGRIGTFIHDLQSDRFTANSIFREMLDLPASDYPVITSKEFLSRISKDKQGKAKDEMEESKTLDNFKPYTLRADLRDGSRRWYTLTARPNVVDGKTVAVEGSLVDITEMHNLQARLRASLAETRHALDELEERRHRQDQMFAIIGHELRTPITSIKMMLEDMQIEQIEPHGSDVLDTTHYVIDVLNDLRLVIRPDDLKANDVIDAIPYQLLERSLASLKTLLREHDITPHLKGNDLSQRSCHFNAQAMRQMVTNLVKNAAIHSKAKNIWVKIHASEHPSGEILCEIRIEDDGIGIPEDQVKVLFEAFTRGNTDADGTGLGLHICNQFAAELGGSLVYRPSKKGGAAFIVELSLKPSSDTPKAPQKPVAGSSLQGRRILFVEDQLTIQMLTAKILEKRGAHVTTASNGIEALDQFDQGDFEVILTDIMMPEMDGYTLTRSLRERGFLGPIIGVTAATVGNETELLMQAGADAALQKPIDINKVEAALERLI